MLFNNTQSYWSGLGFPFPNFVDEYSWVAHAQSQGYATLAIDNLGNGDSDHPDPLNVVQTSMQIEIMYQVMLRLRAGSLPSISQSYKKIIMATHSYGSILGRGLATIYPDDGADAYILTGASNNLTGINAAVGYFHAQSASAVDPTRFSDFAPGYLAIAPQGFRDTVYSFDGDFDPNVFSWDISLPHNFAVGEIAGISGTGPSNFTGPVMVMTGRYDQIVCGIGNITVEALDCGVGRTSNPDQERILFPKASSFESYIPDHTGHNLNTHYSAPETFGAAHAWLTNVGF
jgi:pimeloyl-ACP methyl ester carboxylesterase